MNEMLLKMLEEEEGCVLHAYKDSEGYLTIGIGRLIDKNKGGKISKEEAYYLLNNDAKEVLTQLSSNHIFLEQSEIRKTVLMDMCFNLGYSNLLKFRNMWKELSNQNYLKASKEMLDSKWAKQVGRRAIRLSKMMETNEYQNI